MCRSYCRPCVPRRFSDLAFTSAEVVGAVEMLRRAVASGDDISALFGEWSGLERQTLGAGNQHPRHRARRRRQKTTPGPPPKTVRQKLPEPAKARWAADNRRFPPPGTTPRRP